MRSQRKHVPRPAEFSEEDLVVETMIPQRSPIDDKIEREIQKKFERKKSRTKRVIIP